MLHACLGMASEVDMLSIAKVLDLTYVYSCR